MPAWFWTTYMGIEGGGVTTTVADSVYKQILDAVKTEIQDLNLSGIADANIQIVKVNPERETVLPEIPGILITFAGPETIPLDGGTLGSDDIGYPVAVIMIDAQRQSSVTGEPATAEEGTQDQDYGLDRDLLWREQIRNAFNRQKLTAVQPEIYDCEVEPDMVVDPLPFFEANLWMSSLVFRFKSRERVRNT